MRIVFAGTPEFSVPCLEALIAADGIELVGVVSQPDRKAGRGMRLTPSPVKQLALANDIEVITPERLRDNDGALAWLEEKRADLLVVVAFGMILPRTWLEAPSIAPINVHASLLPRWRGAAPIERAILAGDAETGVCIMQMEEGLDTGPVYARSTIPILCDTTGPQLRQALAETGARLLVDSLPAIAAGQTPEPQPAEGVTYARKLENAERLIDWQQPAAQVDRQVRCFSPQPGARAMVGSKWLKIIAGEAAESGSQAEPGTVVAVGESLDIVCAGGTIYRIRQLQPEGKKPMAAVDFLRGARLQVGDQLS